MVKACRKAAKILIRDFGEVEKLQVSLKGPGDYVTASPAIGANGFVYIGSGDGKLYAIKTSSTGPADSPWPMYGQNAQRTGRAPSPISDVLQITIPDKTASPFTVSFTTADGSTYVFQASGDLKNWSKVEEVNGTGGEVKVTDLREALFKKQYYRVLRID